MFFLEQMHPRAVTFLTVSLMSHVCFFSSHSPVWAATCSSRARIGSPGVPTLFSPPEVATGTAGESAKRERRGSSERKREASRGERKRGTKGGGELLRNSLALLGVCAGVLCFMLFLSDLCHLGSEAAGTLRAAGEAAESSKRRAEENILGSGSLHHHHPALLPQGSQLE